MQAAAESYRRGRYSVLRGERGDAACLRAEQADLYAAAREAARLLEKLELLSPQVRRTFGEDHTPHGLFYRALTIAH
jgi:hypothetical protein